MGWEHQSGALWLLPRSIQTYRGPGLCYTTSVQTDRWGLGQRVNTAPASSRAKGRMVMPPKEPLVAPVWMLPSYFVTHCTHLQPFPSPRPCPVATSPPSCAPLCLCNMPFFFHGHLPWLLCCKFILHPMQSVLALQLGAGSRCLQHANLQIAVSVHFSLVAAFVPP